MNRFASRNNLVFFFDFFLVKNNAFYCKNFRYIHKMSSDPLVSLAKGSDPCMSVAQGSNATKNHLLSLYHSNELEIRILRHQLNKIQSQSKISKSELREAKEIQKDVQKILDHCILLRQQIRGIEGK